MGFARHLCSSLSLYLLLTASLTHAQSLTLPSTGSGTYRIELVLGVTNSDIMQLFEDFASLTSPLQGVTLVSCLATTTSMQNLCPGGVPQDGINFIMITVTTQAALDDLQADTNTVQELVLVAAGTATTTTTTSTPPTANPSGDSCLHIDTLVRAAGGEVRVRDVKVGDSVLAWDSHQEVVRESKVLAFIHHQPELEVEMVQVRVAGRPTPLSLTPSHLVYTCPSGSTPCTNMKFAWELVEGDVLGLVSPHTGQVSGERVDSVQMKVMRGISSPVTEVGTIVANDVVVSCYSTFNYPRALHTLVTIGKVIGNMLDVRLLDTRAAQRIIDIGEVMLLKSKILA